MRLAASLPSTDRSAHEARLLIRLQLRDHLPAVTLYDLLTVVTELVTNAVRHGEGESVGLELHVAGDGTISGEVENEGRRPVEVKPVEGERTTGGLGLHIVTALVDRWCVHADERATRVCFEMAAA